ncbi:general transcription factor IIF subunit 2 [Platysternon megacephalum]|uniref:General transcription factor IIF subunit 2 n=1 Tax=Platysternon megacephalum TaxID=55544 RepID=A0A4D9FF32_9SAUR|nr:general transcription factor IIF subunit 2 [Platysternon megacephalum]
MNAFPINVVPMLSRHGMPPTGREKEKEKVQQEKDNTCKCGRSDLGQVLLRPIAGNTSDKGRCGSWAPGDSEIKDVIERGRSCSLIKWNPDTTIIIVNEP